MKKNYVVVFAALTNFCFAQGTWTKKATFPGLNREWPVAFSIGCYGYVGTGWDSSSCCNNPLTQFWQYDPALDVWTQKADFGGVARATGVGFSIGNKGYIGTGGWQVHLDDFWEYDPATNVWTQKATFPGGARAVAVGFSIGNFGYIGTGQTISGSMDDLWQYNPATDTWLQKASIPSAVGVQEAGCFVIGTDAYIVGGLYVFTVWEYHSVTDTWVAKAAFPGPVRADATGFTICNKGYFGMGQTNNGYLRDIWQYDTLTDSWMRKDSISNPGRDECISFTICNKAYVGLGGEITPKYNDLWEFTPDSSCAACNNNCSSTTLIANFTSSDTTFCSETGKCINFFDHSTGNPTSWQWTFAGGVPDTSTLQNPDSICYSNPGTYAVTLIVSNGVKFDTLAVSPLIFYGTAPSPPTISVAGGDTLISSHASFYQWYFNGLPIGGANDSIYVARQGGTYAVQITDGIGCTSISNGFVITDIYSFLVNGLGVNIYPNPAESQFTVYGLQLTVAATLEIYNVFGEKIYSQQLQPFPNGAGQADLKPQTIDCRSFASGIYFVKVANEKMNWVGKFVKE